MSVSEDIFDVIILGAGPAGLSAAMWCAELGLTSIVLERRTEMGGQLHWIHMPIKNYPGIETGNGAEFLDRLSAQLKSRQFELRTGVEIREIDLDQKQITLPGGETLNARALIVATGIRRRKLGVAGEDNYIGRGILETGQTGREDLKGKTLMIVGGGDAAFENAFNLSDYADKIYLLHRSEKLSARPEFVGRVNARSSIEVILNSSVTKISGADRIESIEFKNEKTDDLRSVAVDSLLVRIGVEANSDLFRDRIETDAKGYINIDHLGRTSIQGIFAIGDVANPVSPTISTAMGMGATAAKAVLKEIGRKGDKTAPPLPSPKI